MIDPNETQQEEPASQLTLDEELIAKGYDEDE